MAGIAQILSRFRRSASSGGLTAVEFRPEGIALAHVDFRIGSPTVSQCVFLPGESAERHEGGLKDMVKALGLVGNECVLVLPPSHYRMFPVEAPPVPPEEMRDAVRWKIKELIDFPVEQAAVDAFPLPDDAIRGGKPSVFAIAAPRDAVRPMLDHIEDTGMNVSTIDISQLALRNLIERLCDPGQSTAVVALADSQSQLMVIRDGSLYLSRPLNFSTRILNRGENEREIAMTQLIGELKRSLDYIEVQLRQDPVAQLAVLPVDGEMEFVMERLTGNVGADVVKIDIPSVVQCEAPLQASIQHHCAAAIGGALRNAGAP